MPATNPATDAFDTTTCGPSEAYWTPRVGSAPVWEPTPGPLVIVAPHPDDETLGAGGMLCTWAHRGLPIILISVTDGEAACPEVADLATVRRAELKASLWALGCSEIQIIQLTIPDGDVSQHESQLAQAIRAQLSSETVLLAPFERDGHPDHDATGRAAIVASLERGIALARYPIWAWHRGSPNILAQSRLVRFPLNRSAQRAKREAISQFQSQLRDRIGGAIVPAHVLRYFARPYEVFLL